MMPTSRIALGLLLALAGTASAQTQLYRSVLGSGGSIGAGPSHILNGTLGQTAIGVVSGPGWQHEIGFWSGLPPATPVDEQAGLPAVFELQQNNPNPFNPRTTIRYAVPRAARVRLRIFDIQGRVQRVLVNEEQAPGWYELTFDAGGLSSGVYFYRMEAGSFMQTKKLMLLK